MLDEGGGEATLGAGSTELLHLIEEPGARPADGYSGLFHFALLVPERADLGSWLAHAGRDGVQLTGASDHFVSEALYLRDPDHHGIEIYADRPRELWEGRVDRMGTWPLDLDDLVAAVPRDDDVVRRAARRARRWATSTFASPTSTRPSASTATCSGST